MWEVRVIHQANIPFPISCLTKEGIGARVLHNALYWSEIRAFPLLADESTMFKRHPRRNVRVVRSIAHQDAKRFMLLALCIDRHDKATHSSNPGRMCHILNLFFCTRTCIRILCRVVGSRLYLIFAKSGLLQLLYCKGSLGMIFKNARYL